MKTLVKTKIRISDDGHALSIWHWKKTWWIFGYWYRIPFHGLRKATAYTEEELAKVNVFKIASAIRDNVLEPQ